MTKQSKRHVQIVNQIYQPTKAEAEEAIVLRNKDGSVPSPTEVMRALTRPVEVAYVEKPRKVREGNGRQTDGQA